MKGEAQVIERLNEALFLELGAVNQYWVHFRILQDWGYTKLAAKERAESIEEMHHADKLIERIIFLEGHANLQRVAPLRIGQTIKEVLECYLAGEYDARKAYKASRELCESLGDYVSKNLFEELLANDETTERTPHAKLRIAKVGVEADAVSAQVLYWLKVAGPAPSSDTVRSWLKQMVPEYQPNETV